MCSTVCRKCQGQETHWPRTCFMSQWDFLVRPVLINKASTDISATVKTYNCLIEILFYLQHAFKII
uniref:Uncharacterized protein n=1 Tax=Arion vulgaris TaxID=1028688 RepID=A0A0B7A210_9EUPU